MGIKLSRDTQITDFQKLKSIFFWKKSYSCSSYLVVGNSSIANHSLLSRQDKKHVLNFSLISLISLFFLVCFESFSEWYFLWVEQSSAKVLATQALDFAQHFDYCYKQSFFSIKMCKTKRKIFLCSFRSRCRKNNYMVHLANAGHKLSISSLGILQFHTSFSINWSSQAHMYWVHSISIHSKTPCYCSQLASSTVSTQLIICVVTLLPAVVNGD